MSSFTSVTAENTIPRMYKGSGQRSSADSLSVLLSESCFSFCLFSGNFQQPLELCEVKLADSTPESYDYSSRIAFLLNNHQLGQHELKRVFISILQPSFALIPSSFAEGESTKDILTLTSGLRSGNVTQHALPGADLSFFTDQALQSELEKRFRNAHIRHAGAVNIALMQSHHSLQQANLFLLVQEGWMEIIARREGELLFYNTFPYSTNEDILYYLLFQMEQSGLDPLNTRLVISCQRPYDDALIKSIQKYLKHCALAATDPGLKMTGDFRTMPSHYYFTLLNQHLCEL